MSDDFVPSTSLQAATQTLGVAAVMILTQRIIISIQEATIQLSSDSESSRSRSRGRPYQGGPSKSTQRHEMELGIRVHHQVSVPSLSITTSNVS